MAVARGTFRCRGISADPSPQNTCPSSREAPTAVARRIRQGCSDRKDHLHGRAGIRRFGTRLAMVAETKEIFRRKDSDGETGHRGGRSSDRRNRAANRSRHACVTLWRVSNHATLDGVGGLRAPGRWHTRGKPIVYCAGSAAAALLETLVHAEIDAEDIPAAFRYLEIEVTDSTAVETIQPADLGSSWRTRIEHTRRTGDDWLQSGRTAILRVPSVIAPETWNFLINPTHSESAAIRIAKVHRYVVDRRLLR